jgi:cytochrome P450 PksS
MHGEVIRKGDMVLVSLIAANSDPAKFTNSAELDITRQINRHVAFGKGIHICIGAPLARMEGQIAFTTLLQRMPHLRLAVKPEQLTWNHTPMRSLTRLPVTF